MEVGGGIRMLSTYRTFFSYPKKCCFIQTDQARLGLVALDLNNHYV